MWSKPRTGCVVSQPASTIADENFLHRRRHGAATAQWLALRKAELQRLDELAAPWRRQSSKSCEVVRYADGLPRVRHAGGVACVTQLARDAHGEFRARS